MRSAERGAMGERYATQWLAAHGYVVDASNYRTRYGEVDLIVHDASFVVFVEVKTRSVTAIAPPACAVDRRKQRRIVLAAVEYLQRTGCVLQPRFDVVEVITAAGDCFEVLQCRHIQNAFEVKTDETFRSAL